MSIERNAIQMSSELVQDAYAKDFRELFFGSQKRRARTLFKIFETKLSSDAADKANNFPGILTDETLYAILNGIDLRKKSNQSVLIGLICGNASIGKFLFGDAFDLSNQIAPEPTQITISGITLDDLNLSRKVLKAALGDAEYKKYSSIFSSRRRQWEAANQVHMTRILLEKAHTKVNAVLAQTKATLRTLLETDIDFAFNLLSKTPKLENANADKLVELAKQNPGAALGILSNLNLKTEISRAQAEDIFTDLLNQRRDKKVNSMLKNYIINLINADPAPAFRATQLQTFFNDKNRLAEEFKLPTALLEKYWAEGEFADKSDAAKANFLATNDRNNPNNPRKVHWFRNWFSFKKFFADEYQKISIVIKPAGEEVDSSHDDSESIASRDEEVIARAAAERKAAEEAARLEAERKAAEETARLETERKGAEEAARLEAERKAAEETARLEAERKAAEETARLETERKAAEEAARLETERKAAEETARLEAERKATEEAARLEAERKATEEAARLEAERKAAEETARLEAERKATEEAARLEAERKATEEAARLEAERKAAEETARLEAERKATEEAARLEAERKATEEAARLEAERKATEEAARLEAERKATEEAARLEAERKATEEAARLEAERKATEEAARLEAERKATEEAARLEAERKATEEAARLEAERKAAEETARLEEERKATEEAARLEAERKATEEAARLEAERKATEEAARLEAERKAAEETARLEAERKAAEEAARLEAQRKAAEETARLEVERKATEETPKPPTSPTRITGALQKTQGEPPRNPLPFASPSKAEAAAAIAEQRATIIGRRVDDDEIPDSGEKIKSTQTGTPRMSDGIEDSPANPTTAGRKNFDDGIPDSPANHAFTDVQRGTTPKRNLFPMFIGKGKGNTDQPVYDVPTDGSTLVIPKQNSFRGNIGKKF